MNEANTKDEVAEAYRAYLRAFRASDVPAIDQLVKYPIAYIGDGNVTLHDRFPINPADLMAQKQWHSSANTDFEVVAVSPTKAHVVLPLVRRLRKDGSLIETASAFYAFTRTEQGWKMFAISDVTVPA